MATHRINIMTANMVPDSSGGVFFEPYSVKATNDIFRHLVLIFNNSNAVEGVYGAFVVPANYANSPVFKLYWSSIATTGDIKMDMDYRAVGGNDTESLDQATFQEALTVTDTAPSAIDERMEATMAATAGNFAADDIVEFFLTRESSNAADTMAAAVILHALAFEYSDA